MLTLFLGLLATLFVSGCFEFEGVLRGRAIRVVMVSVSLWGRAWTVKVVPFRHNKSYYKITAKSW